MKHLNNILIVSTLLFAATFARAIDIYDVPFFVDDTKDRGCIRHVDNAKSSCPTCKKSRIGTADWWVSEPDINLWVSDTPLAYKTSLGTEMAFTFTYGQRSSLTNYALTNVYIPVAKCWSHNWFSYIEGKGVMVSGSEDDSKWSATVHMPGGGDSHYSYTNKFHSGDGTTLMSWDGIDNDVTNGPTGYNLVYPDGSLDIYECGGIAPGSPKSFTYMLTERIDPFGNRSQLYYSTNSMSSSYYLQYVVDPDGKTNTFQYSGFILTNISSPYGQNAHISIWYNGGWELIGLTDGVGITSSFSYTDSQSPKLALITVNIPGGDPQYTQFQHMELGDTGHGNMGGSNCVNRACRVTLPDGSHELYAYRYDSSQVGPPAVYWSAAPSSPLQTIDYGETLYPQSLCYLRNSFHWSVNQYPLLPAGFDPTGTTMDFSLLGASEYKIADMKHWLVSVETTNFLSGTISFSREGSPDGYQDGQLTWYDYPGKINRWTEGIDLQQAAVVAHLLPDNTTQYIWDSYNSYGKKTNSVSTYSTTGGVGTRTNTFIYTNKTASMAYKFGVGQPFHTSITAYWTNSILVKATGPQGETLFNLGGLGTNIIKDIGFSHVLGSGSPYLYYGFSPAGYWTNTYTLPSYATNMVMVDAMNTTNILYYNSRHQVTGIQLPTGMHVTNYYGSDGFLTKTVEVEIGSSNQFQFANGKLSVQTNALGQITDYNWDNLGRLTDISFPDGSSNQITYVGLNLTGSKDRLGRWATATYNLLDQMTMFYDKAGGVTLFGYCSCGTLSSVTNPVGGCTTFQIDNLGRPTQINNYSNRHNQVDSYTQYAYDTAGRVLSVTNSAGLGLTNTYNNQGLVVATSGPFGPIFQARYNIYDLPDFTIDGSGIATTNTYDLLGRVTSTRTANGTNLYLYSGKLLVATVDPLNRTNGYGYDAAGRNTYITNANLEIRNIVYDAAGNITSLSDGKNNPTTWAYDIYGRNIAESNASGVVVRTNGYNANGQMTALWTKGKGLTTYSWDWNGNVTNISYPSSGYFSYTYDQLNRIQTMTDSAGLTPTTFTYQSLGAFASGLLSEVGPWTSDTVTLTYGNGLMTNLNLAQLSGSVSQGYAYDKQLRLQSLASSLAGAFNFSYNAAGGQISAITSPADSIIQAFDAIGNLKSTTLKDQYQSTIDAMTYCYNAASIITNLVRSPDEAKVIYTYDKIDQLTTALGYESNGVARYNETFGYSYDRAGNWMSRTNGALSQQTRVNGLNDILSIDRNGGMTVAGSLDAPVRSLFVEVTNSSQQQDSLFLTKPLAPSPPPGCSNGVPAALYQDFTWGTTAGISLTDGTNFFKYNIMSLSGFYTGIMVTQVLPVTVSFTYDDNRNLLSDGARNLVYDDANRLLEVYATNNWRTTYTYDGLSRRRIRKDYIWQSSNWAINNETHYIYAGSTVIQERNALNQPTVTYTRGRGLLARTDSNGTCYYHVDGNNNVTALVNSQGTLVARYIYDPYGNLIGKWGSMADANLYRFASQEVHPLSGLYAYTYRFYDPSLGRWINRDPIGFLGGRNPFAFVGNNPINNFDPLGLSWRDDLALVGKGFYDLMMGDSVGRPNPNMKGALDAQMGVVDIDRNDNVLRDSLGGVAVAVGVVAKEAAQAYLGGKAAEAAGELLGSALPKVGQIAKCLRGGTKAAEGTSTALSTLRYTTEGETFLRYESADAAFSHITPSGVTPRTFAAPVSDGLVPLEQRISTYNLPNPEIPRPNVFTLRPPAGTPVIGPRPVMGGPGNEVLFPHGY